MRITLDIQQKNPKYWVSIVSKALDLLDCFDTVNEALTLEEIVKRTRIPHTTAYRLLHTLVVRQYLAQSGKYYSQSPLKSLPKFGFANLSKDVQLAVEIENSLNHEASRLGINLMTWDNNRSAEAAVRNAELMVKEKVDLAIEFQLHEHIAPTISNIFARAGIPLISLVNKHPGTAYFGVNNYRAGVSAGNALAIHAKTHWKSHVGAVVILQSPKAGRTTQSRSMGVVKGIEDHLGVLPEGSIHELDGGGDRDSSEAALAKFFRSSKCRNNLLIAGVNDESAMGALAAANTLKGPDTVAIIGHGGSSDILKIVEDPKTPCIGTVSFHPEKYGSDLFPFALPIVQGRSASTGHYISHSFIGKSA